VIERHQDQAMWVQLAESWIGRLAAVCLALFTAARADSVAMHRAHDVRREWERFTPPVRWRLTGVGLLVAVITHLALMSLRTPPGWLWLLIPVMAGSVALALIALASAVARPEVTE
jgi:hypothetical protein